jgi:hypothetical protein
MNRFITLRVNTDRTASDIVYFKYIKSFRMRHVNYFSEKKISNENIYLPFSCAFRIMAYVYFLCASKCYGIEASHLDKNQSTIQQISVNMPFLLIDQDSREMKKQLSSEFS